MRERSTAAERAPLRAADWRFLLPHPAGGRFRTLALLGGPPGLADRLVEIGVADVVVRDIQVGRSVDAVVAYHDANVGYRDLAECLVGGGAVYLEVDRRSPRHLTSTPSRVRDELRRVGLSPTGVYAVGPSLDQPRVYVPLDAPHALPWYMNTLYGAWTLPVAMRRLALRIAAELPRHRVGSLTPQFAVTAVEGSRWRPASVLGLPVLPPDLSGEDLFPLLMSSTHLETLSQRAVILPFGRESKEPLAVVKVSKLPALNDTLTDEQMTMARLREQLDSSMRETIPRPLCLQRWGDITVATESFCAGESIHRSASRWGRRTAAKLDDLRLATTWLAEFHRQTEVNREPWSEADLARFVAEPFDAYRRAFRTTAEERDLFAAAARYARVQDGVPLPIVVRKPDFFGSNVLRAGDKLSVVDWESPHLGPALCDLLRFVVPWGDAVRRVRGDEAYDNFRRLFFSQRSEDRISEAVHGAIGRYLDRLSMDERLVPVLLVYTWVDRALHRVEKQRRQGEHPRDARSGNKHVGRVMILAEYTEQLFGSDDHRTRPSVSSTT